MCATSGSTCDRSPCGRCAHGDEDKNGARCAECPERIAYAERIHEPSWEADGFCPEAVLYRLPTGVWRQLEHY